MNKWEIRDESNKYWDCPGGPVFKTLPSSVGGVGLIPDWGSKILHALCPKNQNINGSNLVRNSIKT